MKTAAPETGEWWFGGGLLLFVWFAPPLAYAVYLKLEGAPPFDGQFGVAVCNALFILTSFAGFCLWRARAWMGRNS